MRFVTLNNATRRGFDANGDTTLRTSGLYGVVRRGAIAHAATFTAA